MVILRQLANEEFRDLLADLPESSGRIRVHPFLVADTVLNGITVYNYNLSPEFMARLQEIRKPPAGTGQKSGKDEEMASAAVDNGKTRDSPDNAGTLERSKAPDPKSASPHSGPADIPETGLLILDSAPYGPGKPFENDYSLPRGVFYRIQLGVYRNPVPMDHFGGLSPITTEYIPERELTRYFAGKFRRMEDAKAALVRVRALGYPDAFIMGYYDGVRVSFSKLKALEK
jgi:hypothetical protein